MNLITHFSNLKHILAKPGAKERRYVQDKQVSCNLYCSSRNLLSGNYSGQPHNGLHIFIEHTTIYINTFKTCACLSWLSSTRLVPGTACFWWLPWMDILC